MEDDAEICFLQGDSLQPACDSVDSREPGPHAPGHSTELLAVASVALADDLVEIRCPQDIVFIGELGQPSLGDFEVLPAVENIQ